MTHGRSGRCRLGVYTGVAIMAVLANTVSAAPPRVVELPCLDMQREASRAMGSIVCLAFSSRDTILLHTRTSRGWVSEDTRISRRGAAPLAYPSEAGVAIFDGVDVHARPTGSSAFRPVLKAPGGAEGVVTSVTINAFKGAGVRPGLHLAHATRSELGIRLVHGEDGLPLQVAGARAMAFVIPERFRFGQPAVSVGMVSQVGISPDALDTRWHLTANLCRGGDLTCAEVRAQLTDSGGFVQDARFLDEQTVFIQILLGEELQNFVSRDGGETWARWHSLDRFVREVGGLALGAVRAHPGNPKCSSPGSWPFHPPGARPTNSCSAVEMAAGHGKFSQGATWLEEAGMNCLTCDPSTRGG
jgi:hypothetical protein